MIKQEPLFFFSINTPDHSHQASWKTLLFFLAWFTLVFYVLFLLALPPLLSVLFLQGVGFFSPSFIFLKQHQPQNFFVWQKFLWRSFVVVVVFILLHLLIQILLMYWVQIFPLSKQFEESYKQILYTGLTGLLLNVIFYAVVPAVCEEFFFRGCLLIALKKHTSEPVALFVSSFLFAMVHFNLVYLPFYFLLGFGMGWLFLRTGNLWLAVLAHMTNNALSLVMFYLLS